MSKNVVRQNTKAFIVPVTLVVLGLVMGFLMSKLLVQNKPSSDSVEAGFSRDMVIHHRQAVEMALIIRDKSSDEDVRTLAYDIVNTQGVQSGMLIGWLQLWGLPQATSAEPMAWMASSHSKMGHSSSNKASVMPGMATDEELVALRSSDGVDAEKQFLRLMIKHHQGGVDMAQGVLAVSKQPDVKGLAQTIVSGQKAEIDLMSKLLKLREG